MWPLDPDGRSRRLLAEGLGVPVNGLVFDDGWLSVGEGGQPGRISRLGLDRSVKVLVDELPGGGDHQTNMVAVGPDRRLCFSQGAMTNAGIVGLDALELGWLGRLPGGCDLPGYDLFLRGVNVQPPNPRGPAAPKRPPGRAPSCRSARPPAAGSASRPGCRAAR